MLKGPAEKEGEMIEAFEHTERFWYWLKDKGITAHRSAIVRAIAEKSQSFFRAIYDETMYEDEDPNEE